MILFLYGEDSYSSWKKLSLIKSRFLASQDAQNLEQYDSDDLESLDLPSIFNLQSLWAGQRLVVFRDVLAEANTSIKDQLKLLLSQELAPGLTVIVWEPSSFDKRQSLYKLLNIPKRAEEFKPLPASSIPTHLKSIAAEVNLELNVAELNQLTQTVGTDLWRAHSEISKLAFCPPELRQKLISKSDQAAAFALQDAIVDGRPADALHVLHQQLEAGSDSTLLVGSLAATLRNIIRIAELGSRGESARQIAVTTAIHPFVVSKLVRLATSKPLSFWNKQYRELSNLDWKIKTGAVQSDSALEFATINLATT